MILSEKYICLRVASRMILHYEFLLAHGHWVKGIWLYKCDSLFIWPTNWYAVPFERFLGLTKKGCALYILYRWFNKWRSCEVVVVLSWTFVAVKRKKKKRSSSFVMILPGLFFFIHPFFHHQHLSFTHKHPDDSSATPPHQAFPTWSAPHILQSLYQLDVPAISKFL